MGDWVGVIGERIVATGADVGAAAVALTTALGAGGIFELLSLYVGADAGAGEAAEVEAALRGTFPKLELEVQRAGQPRYSFLIGLE
jgi:dihydroxyacetone kinase-like predicted kinase